MKLATKHSTPHSKVYSITASLEKGFWFIEIPEINGATQARSINEIEVMVRDYITIMTGDTEIDLDIELLLPEDTATHLQKSTDLRNEAKELMSESSAEYSKAVKSLKSRGLTIREIGKLLGISHQRAHQLLSGITGKK